MDDSSSYLLVLIAGLLGLHATTVLAYRALLHSRHSQLRDRADAHDNGAKQALILLEKPNDLNIAMMLALTMMKFTLAALASFIIIEVLVQYAGNRVVLGLGFLLGFGLAMYTLGEMLPSAFGRAHAEALATRLVLLPRILGLALTPLTLVFAQAEKLVAGPRTGESDEAKAILEEEIIDLVESDEGESAFEDGERAMIRSILEFDETMVREIMVPRPDITAVEINETLREALRLFIESGHSRIPVYDSEIDNVKGVLYAKDLLSIWYGGREQQSSIRELMRQPHFVPETKKAEDLFRELQHSNVHLAVVVDEYGSTAGVITVEDIVEEIVGDIRDEFDATETLEFVQVNEYEYTVDASINLHDLNQLLDSDLPETESDTLGGYLYEHFSGVPEIGERLEAHGLTMRIVSVEGVRIRTVHISRPNRNPDNTSLQHEEPPLRTALQPRSSQI